MGTRRDFANRHGRVAHRVPSDHMTAIGNIHLGVVSGAFDPASSMNGVKLRVERPTENVEREFGDFGANREHG